MDVLFQVHSKEQEHYRMRVEGYGKLYWKKGAYKTSDKELIKRLMRHPNKGKDYKMISNEELVIKYLQGQEPDKLTEEILDNVTLEGIIELGKVTSAKETRPYLIKLELVDEPITDKVQEILDFYKKNQTRKQVEDKVKEDVATKVAVQTSTDVTAAKAIEKIENSDKDEIEGFVTEDEDRVTVIRAYKKKLEE